MRYFEKAGLYRSKIGAKSLLVEAKLCIAPANSRIIGSLLFCTVFYILVAAGAIGTLGGQPIMDPAGFPIEAGSAELARQCAMPEHSGALVCSNEALAHVLRAIGFSGVGNMLGVAAFLALPSVILVQEYGTSGAPR